MKPSHCWTSILHLLFMAGLCPILNAGNETSNCETEIKVRRNTVHKASVGEQLEINCSVLMCDNNRPTITWFKLETDYTKVNMNNRVKTNWTRTSNTEGISFLIFQNVYSNDSGSYQCRNGNDVSHAINVSVKDGTANVNEMSQNQTDGKPTAGSNDNRQMWLYLYSAAGIIGFVIIVIVISVLSMKGCNGKPRKKAQNENQNMAIPMFEHPGQHSSNHALPRGSTCAPTSHRSSRKIPSAHTQRNNVYRDRNGNRERNDPEEDTTVVYVALNHLQLEGAPRPQVVVEESSEYAAIRVSLSSSVKPETEAGAEVEADPQTRSFLWLFCLVGLSTFFIVITTVFDA